MRIKVKTLSHFSYNGKSYKKGNVLMIERDHLKLFQALGKVEIYAETAAKPKGKTYKTRAIKAAE